MSDKTVEEYIQDACGHDQKRGYAALQALCKISEQEDRVYRYFERFVEWMRNDENSYLRTRGLRLMAYNAKWDQEQKLEEYIEEYLLHFEDEKPITARQCIKDSVRIAQDKPHLRALILTALETIHTYYPDHMQTLVYQDRKEAIRKITDMCFDDM